MSEWIRNLIEHEKSKGNVVKHNKRVQFISDNSVENWEWMFPATITLYTYAIEIFDSLYCNFDYQFESCIFTDDGSEVIERYDTLGDAMKGHMLLTEKLGLRFIEQRQLKSYTGE